jgi:hypothetical protein
MKKMYLFIAISLTLGTPLTMAQETVLDRPLSGKTLRFDDHYANAYYMTNQGKYQVVVTYEAGSDGNERPVRQVIQLEDGQTYQMSIGGYGDDKQISMLSISRENDRILANSMSCVPDETGANCF